ncbi:MAG: hypothetical protein JWO98_1185 [Frankiales bacterium]|nr:hypothetical protein [Frankiales bacterium]
MRVSRTCPTCGYTGAYDTAALADAHHRRHSCAKHRRDLEQARRRAERLQARVTRECTHPQASHRHGTRAAYVKDHCRCPDCTAANTAASRTATRERIYGRWHPYVDAGPVRDHIAALRAAGIGVERIAQLAALSVSHIRQLAQHGRDGLPTTQRVRPNPATRVLGIDVGDLSRAPHSRIDATGTRRRLQALIAIGWPTELLADQLGRRPNSLQRSMLGASVTSRTARDVASLYERLWNATPPRATGEQRATSDAARAHSAARGWLPPLAWDDIDTDPTPTMPTAGPSQGNDIDEIAVERALAGDGVFYDNLTSVEQEEAIRRLTARGKSIRDIAAQLSTTKRTVSRRRASLGAASPLQLRTLDPQPAPGGLVSTAMVEKRRSADG